MTEISTLLRPLDEDTASTPPAPPVDHALASGRRALRRRRASAVVGGTVLATVTGIGVTAALPRHDPNEAGIAVMPVLTVPEVVARCEESDEMSDAQRRLLFGPGTPELMASGTTRVTTYAALRSADGEHWGACMLRNDTGGEFQSAMTVYSTQPRPTGMTWGTGPGCPVAPGDSVAGCTTYDLNIVDRRPAEVARVEVTLADGTTVSARTHDTYFVVNATGRLPGGRTFGTEGGPADVHYLRALAFYDEDGALLGREDFAEVRRDANGEELDPLAQWPSLAGNPIY